MKAILVLLAMAMLSGCAPVITNQNTEKGSWTRRDTSIQQTRADYSVCGSGILYTKEGFSQKDYENDLSVCIQGNIDRDRHITKMNWIPAVGAVAQLTTLSVERCMNAKGYKKLDDDTIKSANVNEIAECMKSKGYDWKQ